MDTRKDGVAARLVLSLAAGAALSGCVYAPPYAPYAGYDAPATAPYYSYPYGYAYPAYVGPPISLDFGFGFYDHGYRGGRGWGGHGWGGRGWGGRGWSGGRGGWGGRH
jgi:hypothetical protein